MKIGRRRFTIGEHLGGEAYAVRAAAHDFTTQFTGLDLQQVEPAVAAQAAEEIGEAITIYRRVVAALQARAKS